MNGEPFTHTLLDLGGGLVEGNPAHAITDREFSKLVNFYPFGTSIFRRRGMTRLTGTPYFEQLTGLFAAKIGTGVWVTYAGGLTSLCKLDGNQLVALPIADGGSFGSSTEPWRFEQYQGIAYAIRRGLSLKRVTNNFAMSAGIAAPTVAPTLADGGAGSLEAGDFFGVYTFVNPETGAESNPSPKSNLLTLTALKRRAWSNVGISTNAQVGARNLYVTLPSQPGEYYFVAQLANNFITTYDDNIVQGNLGRRASFDNGLPPVGSLDLLATWQERLWLGGESNVFCSEIGKPESWSEFNRFPVFEDDGHTLRALHPWGARLVAAKTNKVHYFISAGARKFEAQTLSDKHGCGAAESMKSAEGWLFYFGTDRNVYRSGGVGSDSITTVKVRRTLDAIPDSMLEKVVGAVFPTLSWYVLSVGATGHSTNRVVLAYNYKNDAWATFTHPDQAPAFLADFFNPFYGHVLYALLSDGHVYQYNDGNTDYGTPITGIARGRAFTSQSGRRRGVRIAGVLSPSIAEDVTLRIYRDLAETPAASRTVSLDGSAEWKEFNLSTLADLASQVQLEVEYSGLSPLEIHGLSLDGIEQARRTRVA